MPAYDAFAWFYGRYWNEEFHGLAFPVLERIWLARLPKRARILDVCCGTGYLAGLLTERGYRVSGVDASPEMIEIARAHAPAAEFLVAPASDFRLPQRCDAAVSTFDSINHLLTDDELAAAFRNTAASLKRGGLFAFDVLLEEGYSTNWGENFSIVREDHVLLIAGSGFDRSTRIAECRLVGFRLVDGCWQRRDTTVQERCYTPAEIDRALDAAGFGPPSCYNAQDLGMGGALGIGRTFYVTAKR